MSAAVYYNKLQELHRMIDLRLRSIVKEREPKDLSDGCRHVLSAGGKRVRSTLVVLACEAVGGSMRSALDAGTAVELLHNFTLVHDDIMDNAASRRGKPTVHTKWDLNNGVLVGDVLLGLAYRSLLRTRTKQLHRSVELLTNSFLEVCKGQALDLEFERRSRVTVKDYFRMIEMKTGRMISMSAELGAIVGNGSEQQIRSLRSFGHYLGRAFQLQDDLLDVVADEKHLGKTIGGDIVAGKKTFLFIKAVERAAGNDKKILEGIVKNRRAAKKTSVAAVTALYRKYGVLEATEDQIRRNTVRATAALTVLPDNSSTRMLHWFSGILLQRIS